MKKLLICLTTLLLVPAFAGNQNNKPKPQGGSAPARQAQPAARVARDTPRGGQSQSHGSGASSRAVPSRNVPSKGSVSSKSSVSSAGTKTTTAASSSGGITGAKKTTASSGAKTTTAASSSGGITGTKKTTATTQASSGTKTTTAGSSTNGNKRPVYTPGKNVQTTTNKDGTQKHFNPQTQTAVHTDRSGHVTAVEKPGLKANGFRGSGYASHIERSRADGSRMVVNRGPHGERSVESVRRDGVRVVSSGRQGFVERPLRSGYVARTYVHGGRTDARVYRSYTYGRYRYASYVPGTYYRPSFYDWASNLWAAPAVFTWGWGRASWFFGNYFGAATVYPSAAWWLTDFLLAEDLKLAYEMQSEGAGEGQGEPSPAANNSMTLSPEIKKMIAEEVGRVLAADEAAAAQTAPLEATSASVSDAPPPVLGEKVKVFVVSTGLNLNMDSEGQSCALTPGDILKRTSRNLTADGQVPVGVLVSKDGDCPAGFVTALDLGVLQDMHNTFREQIEAGLVKLAGNEGKSGLPGGPAADPRPVAEGQAPAAADAKDLLAQQAQEADRTEAEINQASGGQ